MIPVQISDIKEFIPVAQTILLRVEMERETKTGIVVPQNVKANQNNPGWKGEVVAMAQNCDLKDIGYPDLKVGDIIYTDCQFNACGTIEIDNDKNKYVLIHDGDIRGVICSKKD